MAADKTSSTTAKSAARKPAEVLKVAYTKTGDQSTFVDVVVFGTDRDRSKFLRDNPATWWRIVDLPKGQTLESALAGTAASNG